MVFAIADADHGGPRTGTGRAWAMAIGSRASAIAKALAA